MKTMTLLLIVSLVSSCAVPGDFCVVYDGAIGPLDRQTAEQLVKTDRQAAEYIAVRDEYYKENC